MKTLKKAILLAKISTLSLFICSCSHLIPGAVTTSGPSEAVNTSGTEMNATLSDTGLPTNDEAALSDTGLPTNNEAALSDTGLPKNNETALSETDTVRVMMVGDILLHTPVEESAQRSDGTINFDHIFSNTSSIISSSDLAIVNQEVIIGGKELGISGYPAFNAPSEIADSLVLAGFDVVCHATNHALDKGTKGIINTLTNWEAKYPQITILGIYDNQQDYNNVTIKEVNGIKIALLNYSYGTNGISIPSSMPYCVSILSKDKVIKDLDYAEKNADFTIICPHWGTEYSLTHSESQEKWRDIFIDHGADLVLGTHPHVIQEIEDYSKDGKKMLIYYSLGNFVNWTSESGSGIANRMIGGIADVKIAKDNRGSAYIESYSVIPIVCHVQSGQDGVTVYPISEYSDDLASKNEIIKQDPSFDLKYCNELINSVWGAKSDQ